MQQAWARTPLWKRAEYLHKVDGLMKANAQPMADCLVKEVSQWPCLVVNFAQCHLSQSRYKAPAKLDILP